MKRGTILGVLSVLAFLAAVYCWLSTVMLGSFSSAAGTTEGYARPAMIWTIAMVVSLVASIALAFAAWWCSRTPAR